MISVADKTFKFYDKFRDSWERLYEDELHFHPSKKIFTSLQKDCWILFWSADFLEKLETQLQNEVHTSDGCVCV